MTRSTDAADATRSIDHEYTRNLPAILRHLNGTLLATTYQAGKLVVAGVDGGELALSYHNFERAMGLALAPGKIAVGSQRQVWTLLSAPELAAQLPGARDGCYLTRSALFTGDVQGHELVWGRSKGRSATPGGSGGDTLWLVNTLFSCLCTLDPRYSFVPRWRPPFISAYAAEDRCHLNGVAFADGLPRFVTVLAQSDAAGGWRPDKARSGCVLRVSDGGVVVDGLAMPHSPRLRGERLYLLDSGTGRLVGVDPASGRLSAVTELPGYPRGLAIVDHVAFVGLSKIRETSTFDDIPIAAQRERLKCGVAVVDLNSGRQVAWLQFHSGIDEIFDVQFLPGALCPEISGPYPDVDGQQMLWLAPAPA